MQNTLKVGDVVKLKSGGLEMTIDSFPTLQHGKVAKCVWFDINAKNQSAVFSVDSLEAVAKSS